MKIKTHDYEKFAKLYAHLDIKNTYFLAYRDLPNLISKYVKEKSSLDFGCGTGRSTRFLKNLNFDVVSVDHSEDMIKEAKKLDENGKYFLIEEELPFEDNSFDLILASVVFMEFSSKDKMKIALKEMKRVLKENGVIIITTDCDDMYMNDCIDFKYPNKENVESGEKVKLIISQGNIELYDYYWKDSDYREIFSGLGLNVLEQLQPLGTKEDGFDWLSEDKETHWSIYVIGK